MLTIEEIDEFIKYLRSGELEKSFKEADPEKKGQMLELLERVMDAADLADEIATSLIYRGMIISASRND